MIQRKPGNIDTSRGLPALSAMLCLTVMLLTGCAAKTPGGRMEFHPSLSIKVQAAEEEQTTEIAITETGAGNEAGDNAEIGQKNAGEYSRKGETLRFENKDVKVVIKEARQSSNREGSTVFEVLHDRQFVLLSMSITNKARKKKIRYDPAITALLDSNLGYSKPLDYPSLYEIAKSDSALEKGLVNFRSSFYDLGITVMPRQTVSRYIIFRPISKNAGRAKLVIKNLYTGTEEIDLTFPFVITEAAKDQE